MTFKVTNVQRNTNKNQFWCRVGWCRISVSMTKCNVYGVISLLTVDFRLKKINKIN